VIGPLKAVGNEDQITHKTPPGPVVKKDVQRFYNLLILFISGHV